MRGKRFSALPLLWKNFKHKKQGFTDINLNKENIPRHIAIIMDGNGRWAERRGLSRFNGHKSGARALKDTVKTCADLGVKYLTVFAFSTENWKRPQEEVDYLMALMVEELRKEKPEFIGNGIRVNAIGDLSGLPQAVREGFEDLAASTLALDKLFLNIAVNYGGRQELTNAARILAKKAAWGEKDPESITEDDISAFLYTKGQPDPDLLIRTSGEYRISNFLLWQTAYTEFYFSESMWPDFDETELKNAIFAYQNRNRRFGGRK